MTTSASSLIEQVRGIVRDWGNTSTTLSAAVSDTTGTSVSITDVTDINKSQFILVDNEMMEVLEVYPGTTATCTVVRGSRGSTAATHSSGALVRIEPVYGNHEILRALNQAVDAAFPAIYTLSDSHATTIATDTFEYTIPTACTQLARVEIETSTADIFEVTRQWSYQSNSKIVLHDANRWVGRALRFVGYGKFDAMTISGNLDTDFPDTNANAIEYLVVKAAANMLRLRQAPIARRDSFVGITDSFQQSQPLMSLVTAKDLETQAKALLRQARMPRLVEYLPDPGRLYYGRP